ncbi:hypothetical protein BB559_001932 [Furculomyces boomerangus]|uniref:ATP synthase subunit f, mitochondrial n=1 Tax=Furculomyces boomerangus TaxID=61424 RepID=A0A2T9YZK1_9FUNG|nr:hypothetical protein BB559_001932 [Furculomyces boomerangus]
MNVLTRSIVARRGIHTFREFIPPNIGLTASKIESAPPAAAVDVTAESDVVGQLSSQDFDKLVTFYKRFPKGPAEVKVSKSPFKMYKERYFDSGTFKPVIHLIGALLVGGYSIHYFMHIRYHKHQENH